MIKYIFNVRNILNYFYHIPFQIFQWNGEFEIYGLYVLRDTLKKMFFERGKD